MESIHADDGNLHTYDGPEEAPIIISDSPSSTACIGLARPDSGWSWYHYRYGNSSQANQVF